MTQPIVQFKGLGKSFDELEVMKDFTLDVDPGEIVSIIGPSGSGKTTIIRMLMTLEKPTAGDIIVEGENLWKMQSKGKMVDADEKHLRKVRSNVGMVFQHFNLFPHMTILRNCTEAPIHVLGLSKKEAETRATQMLEKVGLGDKVDNYPIQLSGGQQQRVAIARALVMQPKIMLFDEPTSALDPELVGEVLEVIKDLAQQGDMSMILVTHEMDFAWQVSDRIVFIADGKLVEHGKPSDVLDNPKSERLKNFLERFRTQV
ncbi:ectoine/hydroxyectoine ABC transporter ATP-binding protein EhuA [Alkalicoccobacillus gibsonii]|jgi:polar amino acid transport system ATP-binding protein|uniref:Ectoine/hydroxyectoine ABC transporter ATP-binding protein EhuA n=1 Tax=Alkalicoccobacillus gibsonii TaxID=79881 RepID=A0ABU9VCV3_9BACI|nr:ectoine/hydroxyectoine ABC transporter ATP-binding protein EhuA [Alkalicoccobacillus gibsonii]MBM0067773.1 ectoine/hydroxyectoine ABC transporter ATP-binding protein EhuA [Alkalicoccobacillus gibsonii]